ncbi:hypothetical protein ACROYT_G020127 [Oculina patagonica]
MDLAKLTILIVVVIEIVQFGVDGKERCSCYTFENGTTPNGFSWPQAEMYCKYFKKHLVVMETEREWEFINKVIQTRKGARYDEWLIGLYKILKTGKWTWVNGKPLTIDKWQPNKPKDMEYYALIAKEWPIGNKGLFTSIQGNVFRGWICEEETDNCQVGCFFNYFVPTTSASAETTTPTTQIERTTSNAYGHTNVSVFTSTTSVPVVAGIQSVEIQGDNDNCSTTVTIVTCLAAVFFAVSMILAFVLIRRQKKRAGGHDKGNSAGQRNRHVDQHRSSLRPGNVATELPLLPEAEVDTNERGNQRRETGNNAEQECGYAMLIPSTMMPGDSFYASLVNSEQGAQESASESSKVALPTPLLQPNEEPSDVPPTYANQMNSSDYMNIP